MTTYQMLEEKQNVLQGYIDQYNELHRISKYIKKDIIQPLQREVRVLTIAWLNEIDKRCVQT